MDTNNQNLPAHPGANELVEFLDRIKNMEPEKVSQALDLFERMQTLRARAVFNDSLAAAMVNIKRVKKDKPNPAFKSKYASYESLWNACEDALNSEGILVTFGSEATGDPGLLKLSIRLAKGMYTQEENVHVKVINEAPRGGRAPITDIQAMGSVITYTRRYLLELVLNLVPSENTDDDGNAAGGGMPSPEDVKNIVEALGKHGVSREMISTRLGRNSMNRRELGELRQIYVALVNGDPVEKYFSNGKGNAALKVRLKKIDPEVVADDEGSGDEPSGDLPDFPPNPNSDEAIEEELSANFAASVAKEDQTINWSEIATEMLQEASALPSVVRLRAFRKSDRLEGLRTNYDEGYRDVLNRLTDREIELSKKRDA